MTKLGETKPLWNIHIFIKMGCKEDKAWPISDNSQYNFPFPVFFFHVGKKERKN
jgi:hypothetical protein